MKSHSSTTVTAGTSSPLTDGASVSLLATEEWATAHGIEPLAYFVDAETAAVDYVNGKDGLLMAPTYAVPRLLARNGLSLQDFDFYEIHEAFASVVLVTLAMWEDPAFGTDRLGLDGSLGTIDRSRLNAQPRPRCPGRRPRSFRSLPRGPAVPPQPPARPGSVRTVSTTASESWRTVAASIRAGP